MVAVGLWAHVFGGPETQGGLGRYTRELVSALADLPEEGVGLDYELVSAGPSPDWRPTTMSWHRLPAPRRLLHAMWTWTHRPSLERLGASYELVHSLYPIFPIRCRAPLVVTIHDLFGIDHPEFSGRLDGRALRAALDDAATRAAAIIAVSAWTAGRVCERLGVDPARVEIVPSGVSGSFIAEPASIDNELRRFGLIRDGYVISVGVTDARKNHAVVVRALAQLETMQLVIAGGHGAARARTIQLAEQLGVADRVRTTGPLLDHELAALVAGARVLVHPSIDEGFGLPPLEAMAAGIPTIVAATGSLPEVAGPAADVVAHDDEAGWAKAIHRVVSDDDHRLDLIERGRRHVSQFTWEQTARRTRAVYCRVAAASE